MYFAVEIHLSNLLLSLSDALDLASPQLSQHQLRTTYIAWQIGRSMQIPRALETDMFIAALLHDVGALTPEEKINLHQAEVQNTSAHCILGEKLLSRVPLFETAARLVRFHHTAWIDFPSSFPPDLALSAQIIHLADLIERAMKREEYILHQDQDLKSYVASIKGLDLHPDIVEAFESVAHREDFWLDVVSPRLYSILLNRGPARGIEISLNQLLPISEMFRDMIDFRSQFTATHSSGVAASAAALSEAFGFTAAEVDLMKVAGNLHDLGKMVIPNRILTKPGRLTTEEFAIMRQHTYHTYAILNTIGGIQRVAEWAAFHHEHLDGSGYPFHLDAKTLSINARIMAVADIFTALAEDRPYRPALDQAEVLKTLKNLCDRHWLDRSVVDLLEINYSDIVAVTREKQADNKAIYNQEFLSTDMPEGA